VLRKIPLTIFLSFVLLFSVVPISDVDAKKSSGTPIKKTSQNSISKIVCGDKLCSEVEREGKTNQQSRFAIGGVAQQSALDPTTSNVSGPSIQFQATDNKIYSNEITITGSNFPALGGSYFVGVDVYSTTNQGVIFHEAIRTPGDGTFTKTITIPDSIIGPPPLQYVPQLIFVISGPTADNPTGTIPLAVGSVSKGTGQVKYYVHTDDGSPKLYLAPSYGPYPLTFTMIGKNLELNKSYELNWFRGLVTQNFHDALGSATSSSTGILIKQVASTNSPGPSATHSVHIGGVAQADFTLTGFNISTAQLEVLMNGPYIIPNHLYIKVSGVPPGFTVQNPICTIEGYGNYDFCLNPGTGASPTTDTGITVFQPGIPSLNDGNYIMKIKIPGSGQNAGKYDLIKDVPLTMNGGANLVTAGPPPASGSTVSLLGAFFQPNTSVNFHIRPGSTCVGCNLPTLEPVMTNNDGKFMTQFTLPDLKKNNAGKDPIIIVTAYEQNALSGQNLHAVTIPIVVDTTEDSPTSTTTGPSKAVKALKPSDTSKAVKALKPSDTSKAVKALKP
jgi:hypothetical protein